MLRWKARSVAGFLFAGAFLSGCASLAPQTQSLRQQPPAGLRPHVELTAVPFYPQEDYYCGPAALAMVLNAAGIETTPDALLDQVYLPGRKGSLQVEMLAAARRQGLVAYELQPELADLLREVAAGTPAVVLENYGLSWYPLWHYSVVIGYDLEREEIIRRSGLRERRTLPLAAFEYLWKKEGRWAMVVLPPNQLPATATETRYAAAVAALEKGGRVKEAQVAYGAMLKRWPSSLAAQIGFGNTAYASGDLATAETAFRQATLDHPDSTAAFNNLAQTLADRGKNEQALAAAERAVALGGPMLAAAQATLEAIRKKGRSAPEAR